MDFDTTGQKVLKVWYILIFGKQEGPFSVWDLRCNKLFSPDTLVWKEGFRYWVKARDVPELRNLFQESEELHPLVEEEKPAPRINDDELAINIAAPPPFLIVLIIIMAALVLFYVLYQLNNN